MTARSASDLLSLLRRLEIATPHQDSAIWREVRQAILDGADDEQGLGPLEGLQPLIEELRNDWLARADRPTAAYAVASNTKTGEAYFYGIDAAQRDFCLRFTPRELNQMVERMRAVLAANG